MSWKEVLTLRAAMERAKARSPEVLRQNQQSLRLMKQRASAAEALWAGGHAAEGLSMAREAFEAASAAVSTALGGRSPGAESTEEQTRVAQSKGRAALFVKAGVRTRDVEAAEEAYRAERPLLDDDVSVSDARRVKSLLRIVHNVERALVDDVRTPGSVKAGRLRRVLGILAVVGVIVGAILLYAHERARQADAAWIARYYARANFVGEPQRRHEDDVDFNWGRRSPMVGIPIDGFSARFDACLEVSESQVLKIGSGSDDGARVFVDGEQVLDNWGSQAYTWKNAQVELDAGSHHIRVEFFEGDGDAGLQVQLRSDDAGELVGELRRPTAPDDGCGDTAESRVVTRQLPSRTRQGSSMEARPSPPGANMEAADMAADMAPSPPTMENAPEPTPTADMR